MSFTSSLASFMSFVSVVSGISRQPARSRPSPEFQKRFTYQ